MRSLWVARLAESREVHVPPIDLADLTKASREWQIHCPHRELQAHILLSEVAAVMVITKNYHRPCTSEEVSAMGHNHIALEDSIDATLAPVESADDYVYARFVSGFA